MSEKTEERGNSILDKVRPKKKEEPKVEMKMEAEEAPKLEEEPKVMETSAPKTIKLEKKEPPKASGEALKGRNPTMFNKHQNIVSQKPVGARKYFRSK